jgi:hypothetical protein
VFSSSARTQYDAQMQHSKFSALCFNSLFPLVHYNYAHALDHLKLHYLRQRRYHLDALFLIQVYLGFKFCPSLLKTVGLQVPVQYIRHFFLCSMSALRVKIVLLLDMLQIPMLFVGALSNLEPKMFLLVVFYSGTFLSVKIFIVFNLLHNGWHEYAYWILIIL